MKGHPEVVKLLVQSHANVNVKDNVSTESPRYSLLHKLEIFVIILFSLLIKAMKI